MNKTILITGSTDGIGKMVALKLAKEGHSIYVHGRNKSKLDAVISEIKEESNNTNVNGFVADFSDLDAVRNMAKQINDEVSKLDILINNAGIFKSPASQNEKGLDIRMVVNYLAPYVLTNEILPLLKNSNTPRIVNLSSAAQATVSAGVLRGIEQQSQNNTYAQSKLALTMWSFSLAKNEPSITVIAVNPGSLLNTKMVKEAYGQHWSSADKGMNILYDLATSETYNNDSGKYFDNDKGETKGVFGPAYSDAYDEALISELIKTTKEIINN